MKQKIRFSYRYTVLTIIEVLRQISSKVKKRFPTYNHLVEAGVMNKNEVKALERAQTMTDYPVYWVPITWASNLTLQAFEHGYIKANYLTLIYTSCLMLFSGSWIYDRIDKRNVSDPG